MRRKRLEQIRVTIKADKPGVKRSSCEPSFHCGSTPRPRSSRPSPACRSLRSRRCMTSTTRSMNRWKSTRTRWTRSSCSVSGCPAEKRPHAGERKSERAGCTAAESPDRRVRTRIAKCPREDSQELSEGIRKAAASACLVRKQAYAVTPRQMLLKAMPFGRLAQLVRALLSHGRGHRFEFCIAHSVWLLAWSCRHQPQQNTPASRVSPIVAFRSAKVAHLLSAHRSRRRTHSDLKSIPGTLTPTLVSRLQPPSMLNQLSISSWTRMLRTDMDTSP